MRLRTHPIRSLFIGAFLLCIINPPPVALAQQMQMTPEQYVVANGVMTVEADGLFHPEMPVSRAQVVQAMMQFAYQPESMGDCYLYLSPSNYWLLFKDVPTGAAYGPALCMAMRTGVIDGYADATFRPNNTVNFAEASKIITQSLRVVVTDTDVNLPWYTRYTDAMHARSAFPTTMEHLDRGVTKGDLAYMIMKLGVNRV